MYLVVHFMYIFPIHIFKKSPKFLKSSTVNDKHLNFIIGIEKTLNDLLKEEIQASEIISEIDYKKLKPLGSSFGVLYGFFKTHKNCP